MKLPFDSDRDCVLAWEAMPWALQDSLTPQQAERLNRHLPRCESCRAEFAQQKRLQHALSLPPAMELDVEAGLQRLLSRLDTPIEREPGPSRTGNWLGRAVVAAMLLQTAGLGVMGAMLWSTDQNPSYRTLSQAPAPLPADAIRVVPDASMTLADWNALLNALGLRVVAGPNDVGAYTVAPVLPESARRQALVQKLRATRGIRLAEPVATTP